MMRERAPVNCRRISQNFSLAGVTSPFEARAKEQAFARHESKNRDEVRDQRFAPPRQQLFG